MKRILMLMLLCLRLDAAIALVNQAQNFASAASSITVTITDTVAGNALILGFGSASSSVTVSSISGCGTWVSAKKSNVQRDAEIWYALNISASCTSVAVTAGGGSANLWGYVSEWSGMPASGTVVDGTPGSNSNASTITPDTGSTTTANASSLLFGVTRCATTVSSGPTNSFTGLTLASNQGTQAAYKLPGATGTYTTGWTMTGAGAMDGVIVGFLAAGGGFPAVY